MNEEMERLRIREERYEYFAHLVPNYQAAVRKVEKVFLLDPFLAILEHDDKLKALMKIENKVERVKHDIYSNFMIQLLRVHNKNTQSDLKDISSQLVKTRALL